MTFVNAEVFQERLEGTLDVYTNQLVFAPGEPIFVHGQGMPKEPIIIRLFSPDDTIAEFEQLMTGEDGSFHHFLMEWDQPTTNLRTRITEPKLTPGVTAMGPFIDVDI